jgi:ribosomal protein S18 acetylase RimI-like enzyme
VDEMTFAPFDPEELGEWLHRERASYIQERINSGDTPEEATANADLSLERSFPGGSPGALQMVGRVLCGSEHVGELWIGPFGSDPRRWWVWNIVIDEQKRARGYGRKTMILAEELAAARGATSIGLNVFAHNSVARHLYQSLGYEETSVQMRKVLDPA